VSSSVEADQASATSGIDPFGGTPPGGHPAGQRPAAPNLAAQYDHRAQPSSAPYPAAGLPAAPPPFGTTGYAPRPPVAGRTATSIGLGVEFRHPAAGQVPVNHPGYGAAIPQPYPAAPTAYPAQQAAYPAQQAARPGQAPQAPPSGARRVPSAMHVPMRTLGEPPAGLGQHSGLGQHTDAPVHRTAPGVSSGGYPPISEQSWLLRYWWVSALVGVVVLGALGIGTWALLGGGSAGGDYQRLGAHGLSYGVPKSWTSQNVSDLPWVRTPGAKGIYADGVGIGAQFPCGGQQHPRASFGVLQVYRNDSQAQRPQDAVRDLGMSYAATVYGDDAPATISEPLNLNISGVTAATSLITVRPSPSSGCPVGGRITVIALPSSEADSDGHTPVQVFMLQHDTSGGPGSSALLTTGEAQQILASVKIAGH
jgi:hypothetical protein